MPTVKFDPILGKLREASEITANQVAEAGATMDSDESLAGNGYFLDEDDMASNSDEKVPSQQSVKAYALPIVSGVNVQEETSYTLVAADNGKIITLNNAAAITLTVPSGLGAGFNCTLIQKGAGQVTLSADGTTINNRQDHTKLAGQDAMATLCADVADNFYFQGDTE